MVVKAIMTVGLLIKLSFLYVFGNIALHIPCLRRAIIKQMNKVASIVMPVENYWHTLLTWPMMKTLWKYGRYEICKTSKVGRTAPNPRLISVDTDEIKEVYLQDLVKPCRPLVVIFGSWTCPVFVERLEKLHEIYNEFSAVADFVVIYVQEAHPEDGWRMENNYEIMKHKCTDERAKAAKELRSLLCKDIPLCIDRIDNQASKAYSGCPNRILLIEGTSLSYQNGPGPTYYFFDDITTKLNEIMQSTNNN